ncbi:MAG: hypothetical protein PHN82_09560 [bacterium]|nr:hypothetical protein [bacterium]
MKKEDKFSATEVGTLIEAIRSEIKPVLEAIPGMKEKLDRLFEKVEGNTGKIELNRVLITRVLEELKSKVAREDFEILARKVSSLAG